MRLHDVNPQSSSFGDVLLEVQGEQASLASDHQQVLIDKRVYHLQAGSPFFGQSVYEFLDDYVLGEATFGRTVSLYSEGLFKIIDTDPESESLGRMLHEVQFLTYPRNLQIFSNPKHPMYLISSITRYGSLERLTSISLADPTEVVVSVKSGSDGTDWRQQLEPYTFRFADDGQYFFSKGGRAVWYDLGFPQLSLGYPHNLYPTDRISAWSSDGSRYLQNRGVYEVGNPSQTPRSVLVSKYEWSYPVNSFFGTRVTSSGSVWSAINLDPDASSYNIGSGPLNLGDHPGQTDLFYLDDDETPYRAYGTADGLAFYNISPLEGLQWLPGSASLMELMLSEREDGGRYTTAAYLYPYVSNGTDVTRVFEIRRWGLLDGLEVQSRRFNFLPDPGDSRFQTPYALSGDGLTVAAVSEGQLVVARIDGTAESDITIDPSTQHVGTLSALALSADGSMLLTGDEDGGIVLWDGETGQPMLGASETNRVWTLAFSDDGTRFLAESSDRSFTSSTGTWEVGIWDTESGTRVASIVTDESGGQLAFSADKQRVMFGNKVFTIGGTQLAEFEEATEPLAFSSDGRRLADANGIVYDVDRGEQVQQTGLAGHPSFGEGGDFLAMGADDGQIVLFDVSGEAREGETIRTKDKIILVAGGGDYPGNAIADQTEALAEYSHFASALRGYDPDDEILYLSAFPTIQDPDNPDQQIPNPRVDGSATLGGLEDAILEWGADAQRLIIGLLDHGERAGDDFIFLLDATQSPRELLYASELDRILDEAQSGDDPLPEALVYVDMCYSGGFLRKVAGAPSEDLVRIVMASTTDDRLASFGGRRGQMSFSGYFWSAALQGNSFLEAFQLASESIVTLNVPPSAPQRPWLDDDGDGRPTLQDGRVARLHTLGSTPAFGNLPPEIVDARPDFTIPSAAEVELWAELGATPADGASAFVVFGNAVFDPDDPITSYTEVELAPGQGTRWSGQLAAEAFPYRGDYTVLYTAEKGDALQRSLTLQAVPLVRQISVEQGPEPPQPPPAEIAPLVRAILGQDLSTPDDDVNQDGALDAGDLREAVRQNGTQ